MATAWSEEETFICSVCLDTLKEPATLPCGHSYCLLCIQSHWDKKDSNGQYSCPQCRQVFKPRPSLAKSTVLVEAMEKLRANSIRHSSAPPSMPIYLDVLPGPGPQQGSVYPQLPQVEPRPCPQHNQPLDLFCRDDKECVCKECCQQRHKGHQVFTPQEERGERQVSVLIFTKIYFQAIAPYNCCVFAILLSCQVLMCFKGFCVSHKRNLPIRKNTCALLASLLSVDLSVFLRTSLSFSERAHLDAGRRTKKNTGD